jgi:predicted phage tail protein|tara:strand:- start:709 stop:1290 length:582 start_codon:yes stop_codon:yes gene_type:complete
MLSKITVYGRLARFLGQRTFEAEINSSVDAIRFLLANFPKLQSHMIEQNYCIKVGNYSIDENEIEMPVGSQDVKIVPVIAGSKRGLGKFIAGIAIVGFVVATGGVGALGLAGGTGFLAAAGNIGIYLALSGAAEMLTPVPKPPGVSDDPQQRNFSFNGVQNTGRAGVAIPVVYGEIFTGSLVVSAGIDTEDIL